MPRHWKVWQEHATSYSFLVWQMPRPGRGQWGWHLSAPGGSRHKNTGKCYEPLIWIFLTYAKERYNTKSKCVFSWSAVWSRLFSLPPSFFQNYTCKQRFRSVPVAGACWMQPKPRPPGEEPSSLPPWGPYPSLGYWAQSPPWKLELASTFNFSIRLPHSDFFPATPNSCKTPDVCKLWGCRDWHAMLKCNICLFHLLLPALIVHGCVGAGWAPSPPTGCQHGAVLTAPPSAPWGEAGGCSGPQLLPVPWWALQWPNQEVLWMRLTV